MALLSAWFRGNNRLERCLVSDPEHVQKGDRGEHVRLIHGALETLDQSQIAADELTKQLYGPSTANAVLAYKKKRKIINFSYQTSADNIVGKMTIRALDAEMLAREVGRFHLLLGFGATFNPPKIAILSEGDVHAQLWAKQVATALKPHVVLVQAPGKATAEQNVVAIKRAIEDANGGLLIFNVGHGFCLLDNVKGNPDEGGFDIAPDAAMRLEGKNTRGPKQFVSVFYDDKPPQRSDGGEKPLSDKDKDEKSGTPEAKKRLKNFAIYEDLSKTFVAGRLLGVVLATCKVGRATGFLKKVATQWKTPIIAYRDTWMFFEAKSRRTRAIMAGDQGRENTKNPGTNTPFGEIMIPLSLTDMVVIQP